MHTITQTAAANPLFANVQDRVVTVGAHGLHACRRISVRLYPGHPAQSVECPMARERCQGHWSMKPALPSRRSGSSRWAVASARLRLTSRGGSRRPGSSG